MVFTIQLRLGLVHIIPSFRLFSSLPSNTLTLTVDEQMNSRKNKKLYKKGNDIIGCNVFQL